MGRDLSEMRGSRSRGVESDVPEMGVVRWSRGCARAAAGADGWGAWRHGGVQALGERQRLAGVSWRSTVARWSIWRRGGMEDGGRRDAGSCAAAAAAVGGRS